MVALLPRSLRICLWLTLALYATLAGAARDSLENRYDIAVYDNGGKPDLTVDPIRLKSQLNVIDRYFDPANPSDVCAFNEGTIGAYGWRRLMVFDVVIVNAGNGDLVVGDRSDPNNPYAGSFYFDACHGHYHMRGFSEYRLIYKSDGNVATIGRKQGSASRTRSSTPTAKAAATTAASRASPAAGATGTTSS